MKFVDTTKQIGYILTKGSFTRDELDRLIRLFIMMDEASTCSHFRFFFFFFVCCLTKTCHCAKRNRKKKRAVLENRDPCEVRALATLTQQLRPPTQL